MHLVSNADPYCEDLARVRQILVGEQAGGLWSSFAASYGQDRLFFINPRASLNDRGWSFARTDHANAHGRCVGSTSAVPGTCTLTAEWATATAAAQPTRATDYYHCFPKETSGKITFGSPRKPHETTVIPSCNRVLSNSGRKKHNNLWQPLDTVFTPSEFRKHSETIKTTVIPSCYRVFSNSVRKNIRNPVDRAATGRGRGSVLPPTSRHWQW